MAESLKIRAVVMTNPLKQGLKQWYNHKNTVDHKVVMTNPLKQGLKPGHKCVGACEIDSRNDESTKTRIETHVLKICIH